MDGLVPLLSDNKLWAMMAGSLLFPVLLKMTEMYLKRHADQQPSAMQLLEAYRTELGRLSSETVRLQQLVTQREKENEELWSKVRLLREELQIAHLKIAELEFKYGGSKLGQ